MYFNCFCSVILLSISLRSLSSSFSFTSFSLSLSESSIHSFFLILFVMFCYYFLTKATAAKTSILSIALCWFWCCCRCCCFHCCWGKGVRWSDRVFASLLLLYFFFSFFSSDKNSPNNDTLTNSQAVLYFSSIYSIYFSFPRYFIRVINQMEIYSFYILLYIKYEETSIIYFPLWYFFSRIQGENSINMKNSNIWRDCRAFFSALTRVLDRLSLSRCSFPPPQNPIYNYNNYFNYFCYFV